MKLGIFVTGTNTEIGKTTVSALIFSALRAHSIRAGYFKPIQTGTDSDTETVAKLTGLYSTHATPLHPFPDPVYSFPDPKDPWRASQMQGLRTGPEIQIDRIVDRWNQLDHRAWIVEGAGGLLVPLNSRQTVRDLIKALELRVLVVASTQLGTINHTLLTLEAAQSVGLKVCGIVLVGQEDPGLQNVFASFTQVPVLTHVPALFGIDRKQVVKAGPELFSLATLQALYD